MSPSLDDLRRRLAATGHAHLSGEVLQPLLAAHGDLSAWAAVADSWDDLAVDPYLAEGHRCRRRRYAVYAIDERGSIDRQAHQAHYQSSDYNRLFGGIERWFEPVRDGIAASPALLAVIRFCHAVFGPLSGPARRWHVELHQFRIEARSGQPGQPTPEGVHRDGVDYVLVLLVRRRNIASGTTTIHAPDGTALGSFTLTHPFDAALIDDRRVYHGVTPVEAVDPVQPAYRDVLVVTLRAL